MIRYLFFLFNLSCRRFYTQEIVDKNGFSELRNLLNKLSKTKFCKLSTKNTISISDYNNSLNQYIKIFFQRTNIFVKVLIFSKSKKIGLIYPLPRKMLKTIDDFGYKVNFLLSQLLWIVIIILSLFYGVFYFFYTIFLILKNFFFKNYNEVEFCFVNLETSKNKEIIKDWISNQYNISEANIKFGENNAIFGNIKKFQFINFFIWFGKNLVVSIFKLFLFEWSRTIFLAENIKSAVVKYSLYNSKKKIIFYWKNNIYRPLWTLESNFDTTMIYGGSFNELLLKEKKDYEPDYIGTEICTWNKHLVIDKSHENFLRKKYPIKIETEILKESLIFDTKKKKVQLPLKYIAVFGYENNKTNYGIGSFTDYEYSHGRYYAHGRLVFDFYSNLLKVCEKNDLYLVKKKKKEKIVS